MTRSTTSAPARQPRPRRAALPLLAVLATILTIAVPLSFPDDGGPNGWDRAVGKHIHTSLDGHRGVYDLLVAPSNWYVVTPLLFAAVGWFAYRRRWLAAGFVLLAPELAMIVNTLLLKPFWDRPLHDYLAYPSGHTVHLVAIATAVALVSESARVRVAVAVLLALILPLVLIGMTGLGYHHPTDVIGGTAAAIAMVTAAYLPIRARVLRAARTGTPPPERNR
ncbi:phosphatase PAP2 family protein [Nocardia sp. NPDC005978]|uniref:phosphatase PAP2 family protein n=1 Tax=Nocardia sp. NPDC005978 TaxID=3156725 RepID=UPI0033B2DA2E